MLLVDVREPNETALERYPERGRSCRCRSFDPAAHARSAGQAGGVRLPFRPPLGDRVARRAGPGYPYKSHLAGGIMAWKAAGLPTKTG